MWDPSDDTSSFPYSKLLDTDIDHTKRGISKIISAIFDINGEISPFILRVKMILSMTWAYEKPEEDHTITDEAGTEEIEKQHCLKDSTREI